MTSGVLLQQFLRGLRAPVSKQVLLGGKPESLEDAIEEATRVKYALNFESQSGSTHGEVNAVHYGNEPCHTTSHAPSEPIKG